MSVPIEDGYEDVVAKAQRGLGLSSSEVAERAGLDASSVKAARRGVYEEADALKLADVLNLKGQALKELAPQSVCAQCLALPRARSLCALHMHTCMCRHASHTPRWIWAGGRRGHCAAGCAR